ncbi:unnamed protein product [Rotaria sordida]|uniref:Uncharacterized protein n=1 Tax=Rotaria sordida TaxID=392033 RepID=A0A813WI91_9BILA|nr:unnamed protein product [Rotaria sordida]CAF1030400.1 unnamed protein product [Rotaria sordida]CAF1034313.1 unnamed protein product [Rotaria sordida]CAF1160316.1 unnamed protein product [Rotaria sordida]CAF3756436.1 unnamed protein product [Rotaria sordida]
MTLSTIDSSFNHLQSIILNRISTFKFSQLRLLNVTIECFDKSYLNSKRWKTLNVEHIPYLIKFILSYMDYIDGDDDDFEINDQHALINHFTS